MAYTNIESCLDDLEKNGQLIRIKEEVDPYLEMAAIQLCIFELNGKAVLFENIKGCKYRAASNIFGTLERSEFIFRDTLPKVKEIIALRKDPIKAIRHPFKNWGNAISAYKALSKKISANNIHQFEEIKVSELPQIQHWEQDGGAFITLPQVYSENINHPAIMHSNLGMYRVQLSGNEYIADKEIGLHYQIHRGIGVHQSLAKEKNQPLKVSIFVGGPPAHTLAAVMPLPEGLSELTFAGLLGGRRFRYFYYEGYCMSADADFIITGEVSSNEIKPEGPFGDHLGYYSLKHPFPVIHIHKVFAKKRAIWPFTVVGRPPQEDTVFGKLIHEITGDAIEQEIPGLKAVHAVDAAGVHPLLLAIGSERYTPFMKDKQPAEILTLANRILGTGQLSLAKYLLITAVDEGVPEINNVELFFKYMLERIDLSRDVHFQTNTTIDTLDYSGDSLNRGSKVIFAAYGDPKRTLAQRIPVCLQQHKELHARLVLDGVATVQLPPFSNYETAQQELTRLTDLLQSHSEKLKDIPLIVISDDSDFTAESLNNFLWVTFTRSNPSNDIYGINSSIKYKHWGCDTSLIIDARVKPHHAPALQKNIEATKRAEELLSKYF